MNRRLIAGDKVTFREEAFEHVRSCYSWLPCDWSTWNREAMPLAILAEYAGGMTNRRRVFLVGTPAGQTASTYPCEIKLDDRAKRLKEHDKI